MERVYIAEHDKKNDFRKYNIMEFHSQKNRREICQNEMINSELTVTRKFQDGVHLNGHMPRPLNAFYVLYFTARVYFYFGGMALPFFTRSSPHRGPVTTIHSSIINRGNYRQIIKIFASLQWIFIPRLLLDFLEQLVKQSMYLELEVLIYTAPGGP